MKICALGNSHVACLKLAWDAMAPARNDMSITFFAARNNRLAQMVVKNNHLVPDEGKLARDIAHTSGGLEMIDPGEYDAFLVYALGFATPLLPAEGHYSEGFVDAMVEAKFDASLNRRLCDMIASISRRPILVGHNPLPASAPGSTPLKSYAPVAGRLKKVVNNRGFILVDQPAATIGADQHTKPEFTAGSRRLDVGDACGNELHPDTDLHHMNDRFGAHILSNVFDLLPLPKAA